MQAELRTSSGDPSRRWHGKKGGKGEKELQMPLSCFLVLLLYSPAKSLESATQVLLCKTTIGFTWK